MILSSAPPGGINLISLAMVIFMAVFVMIVLWVIFARRGTFRRQSQIPLHDDDVVTPRRDAPSKESDS